MKLTVVCIDGLGSSTLDLLNLKRLSKRMHGGKIFNPTIRNVVSRGWPEIYTGQTAYENGSFYQSPKVSNDKIYATQNTGYGKLIADNPRLQTLWDQLSSMGLSVGVFTVPTVPVLNKISGFSVGATGGGNFGNNLDTGQIYPLNLFNKSEIHNVDLGLRMGFGGFIPNNIAHLSAYGEKHLNDYFKLLNLALKRQPTDVTLIGTRFINEMGYKFIGLFTKQKLSQKESDLKNVVLSLCEKFDRHLDDFLNQNTIEHTFIVSDHGIGPFKYEINLNEYLYSLNYISKIRGKYNWKVLLHPIYRKKVEFFTNTKMSFPFPKYDLNNSKAFSIGFTNVIYLNDQRFTGVAYSASEREKLLNSLTNDLNKRSIDFERKAAVRFERIDDKITASNGPDILCRLPAGVANTERRFDVLYKVNPNYGDMFQSGFHGEYSGCKSEDTLSAYSGNCMGVEINDLTDTLNQVIRVARNEFQ
ncbi:alkaline phosphatase family protein [Planktomarina temperata]|nr:alkaline phosphatase family protein [Planktomarina temperata]